MANRINNINKRKGDLFSSLTSTTVYKNFFKVNNELIRENKNLQRQTTQYQTTLKDLMGENLELNIQINQLKQRIQLLKDSDASFKVFLIYDRW